MGSFKKSLALVLVGIFLSSCAKTYQGSFPEVAPDASLETRAQVFKEYSFKEESFWWTRPNGVKMDEQVYFLNDPMLKHIEMISPTARESMAASKHWLWTQLGLLLAGAAVASAGIVTSNSPAYYGGLGLLVGSMGCAFPAAAAVQRGTIEYNHDLEKRLGLRQ